VAPELFRERGPERRNQDRRGKDGKEAPATALRAKGQKPRKGGQPFIVLTGLSGSGKSQAIRALEDLGYFCVDNLPTTLIPTLAKLSLRAGGDIQRVAIVVDVREGGFLSSFPKIFRQLRDAAAQSHPDLSRRATRRWSGGSARRGGRIRWRRPIGERRHSR
jgi:hypothetical protein